MNYEQIIKLQQEAIEEYKSTFKFINKVMVMIIKDERNKPLSQRNSELLDLAENVNDCITDQPTLREIHEKIKELMDNGV